MGAAEKEKQFIDTIKKDVFPDATSITRIGSNNRMNSDTFRVQLPEGDSVVIKLLKANRYVRPDELEQEQKAHERIKESGKQIPVSELISFGTVKLSGVSTPYLVFPFIDGYDLARTIGKSGTFTEAETLKFINFGVGVIDDLRKLDIIHQDIKPGNIIKHDKGYTIIDLGIAKFINFSRPELAKPQGPARYLSPEKTNLALESSPKNERQLTFVSDLYSLGVVCFELLTGSDFGRLWDISKRHEVSDKIRTGEVLDIQDKELREKLAALLELSVADRLQQSSKLFGIELDESTFLTDYWLYNPSQKAVRTVCKDLPEQDYGIILPAKKCTDTTKKFVAHMQKNGWSVIIDPLTYRMQFNKSNHEDPLARLPYYLQTINEHFMTDPLGVSDFTNKVIAHQQKFNPDYYIAPYFYIEKPSDKLLDLSFNTYKMAKAILVAQDVTKPLAFSLVLSKQVLMNEDYLRDIADQIILRPEFDHIYLQVEVPKSNHLPFADKRVLSGLDKFLAKLAPTKAILVANIDQSILCSFAKNQFAIGINPKDPRKHDIEYLIKERPRAGIKRKKEHTRYRVYLSDLLSDLDIDRDINKPGFVTLNSSLNMGGDTKYSRGVGGITNFKTADGDLRVQHFIQSFGKQMTTIRKFKPQTAERKAQVLKMFDRADDCFSQLDKAGIALDAQNTGEFIDTWRAIVS